MTAKKFPRDKNGMERQIDIDRLLESSDNVAKSVTSVLSLASECFTVELAALEKMSDTVNSYIGARRNYDLDTVSDSWEGDHSHIRHYEDPSYG